MSITQPTMNATTRASGKTSSVQRAAPNPLFHNATMKILRASALERLLMRVMQLGARVSGVWGYRGFGACCALVQKLARGRHLTMMLEKNTSFVVPFADPYWSMLLGGNDIYETDIETFLRSARDERYTLIDCGANYGYWSVLASGPSFGSQRVIAIEPSSQTFGVLQNNAAVNDSRFSCMQKAVGAETKRVNLSGHKHEARAVAVDGEGEIVEMLTLDRLMDDGYVNASEKVVVKLDVEGQEIAALSGGTRLLGGECVVICEDHGSDRNHTVSRYILANTPLRLFCFDPEAKRFVAIDDVTSLDRIKRFRNQGYNVFATSSSFWAARILLSGYSSQAALVPDDEASGVAIRKHNLMGAIVKGYLLFSALILAVRLLDRS